MAPATEADVPALAAVLVDCVEGGASVGFLAGLGADAAAAWWLPRLQDDGRVVLVAREGSRVVGTVTLLLAEPENGAHRAEVSKLLVPRAERGRGIGRALLQAVEQEALGRGRHVLLLDTETGSAAQRLYEQEGWEVVGVVPDHAARPDGTLAPTTYLTKRLAR